MNIVFLNSKYEQCNGIVRSNNVKMRFSMGNKEYMLLNIPNESVKRDNSNKNVHIANIEHDI
jgi:hypothetical protein